MTNRLYFARAAAAALFLASAAAAEPHHLKSVATKCVPLRNGRVAPGADADAAGEKYAALSSGDATLAAAFVSRIFGAGPPDTADIPAVYFHDTQPDGEQWKEEGNWPIQAFRSQTGNCSTASPQSLGRAKEVSYALVEVTCPSGHAPWTNIRVGLELSSGKVTSFCANVGDYGSILLPDAPRPRHTGG